MAGKTFKRAVRTEKIWFTMPDKDDNDVRYDWEKGSVLWMPFGSKHQHYNAGTNTARYLSFTALHLLRSCGLPPPRGRAARGVPGACDAL